MIFLFIKIYIYLTYCHILVFEKCHIAVLPYSYRRIRQPYRCNLGLLVKRDGEAAGLLDVGAGSGGVHCEGRGGDGAVYDSDVPRLVREPWHGGLAERDGVGRRGGRDGEVVIEVDELLVGVPGGEREVDGVGERGRGGGGGEAELGDARHGEREGRAVRAVEQVECAANDGRDEGEEEEDDHRPEEAAAATERAGPVAAVLGAALLRPVDGPLVHLGRVGGRRRRGGLAVGRH
jgi:hypothetical protein